MPFTAAGSVTPKRARTQIRAGSEYLPWPNPPNNAPVRRGQPESS